MSRKDRLTAFAKQIGFEVEDHPESDPSVVRAFMVPCLFLGGVLGTCTIETSYDPVTGKPDNRVGRAVHAVKVTVDTEHDGRVYHADGSPIGNYVDGDGRTWSNISIKRGVPGRPESDATAHDLLHRYVKHVVGAVASAGHSEVVSLTCYQIRSTYPTRSRHGPE